MSLKQIEHFLGTKLGSIDSSQIAVKTWVARARLPKPKYATMCLYTIAYGSMPLH